MSEPFRILQVGAGPMGRAWLRTIAANPDVVLAGLVDLDVEVARRAADEHGFTDVPVAASLGELADRADAVIDVTVPVAHPTVSTSALIAGLPVLCEKPLAETVREGLQMAAAAEVSGKLLMVSQSRRYFRAAYAFQRQIAELGPVGTLSCEFFKAPRLDGFRARMAEPLLVDMAIHQFDFARKVLGSEPVSVYCESYNPQWSWFDGNASATAIFRFADDSRFTFTGSWVAPGLETSWNGQWRASTSGGTAIWDGDRAPVAQSESGDLPAVLTEEPEEIAGSLVEFVAAVRAGGTPQSEVHSNVISLAMVEAAVRSAREGAPVLVADVLTAAHAEAVETAPDPAVRAALESWEDVLKTVGL
ncbi:Gfo/Idh/MocA family oxidoreductase [Kribbella sandramycini]|uniref:Gfo/Idh/MocA family oxidoreductase n=1 Tax=Kribbella sandramycini TaxID=60450 RepID=A0A7Y4L102_9ACTN|nr:Gfo/Idh/MocA family oxidoreductase [Kribbella sandramycini]MBB6564611.1 putative dehydrogenase [Kribbella sandramycini]NOL42315.1 Gfo/Idh/MocA family oxidoreductase [Kribbella sandramycini]